jgi:hypothetical protein
MQNWTTRISRPLQISNSRLGGVDVWITVWLVAKVVGYPRVIVLSLDLQGVPEMEFSCTRIFISATVGSNGSNR